MTEYWLALRLLVVKVATPPLRAPVPRVVDPLRNVIVPVGLAEPEVWDTVADKVTLDPRSDCVDEGVAVMLSDVVVAPCPEVTVSVSAGEVEPL